MDFFEDLNLFLEPKGYKGIYNLKDDKVMGCAIFFKKDRFESSLIVKETYKTGA